MNLLKNILFLTSMTLVTNSAHAAIEKDGHRFALSGGLVYVNQKASLAISTEYEYRLEPLYGIGAQASYVFASEAITQLAAPTFFLHPLEGEWIISASPVFYFSAQTKTRIGARFTTRMPLEIEILTLVPTFGIDVIEGGPNYILGLAFGI